jgi:hypothetical protein
MTIKSTLSVIALAAGLVAGPALAQDLMIGTQTVAEADVEAVKARCADLKLADETASLSSTSETDTEDEATDDGESADESVAGDADMEEVPATDSETATTVDLGIITLAECEADGWFDM